MSTREIIELTMIVVLGDLGLVSLLLSSYHTTNILSWIMYFVIGLLFSHLSRIREKWFKYLLVPLWLPFLNLALILYIRDHIKTKLSS